LLDNPVEGSRMGQAAYENIANEWNAGEAGNRLLLFYEQWKCGKIEPVKGGPFSVAPVIAPKKMYQYMKECISSE